MSSINNLSSKVTKTSVVLLPDSLAGEHSILQYPPSTLFIEMMKGRTERPDMSFLGYIVSDTGSVNWMRSVG